MLIPNAGGYWIKKIGSRWFRCNMMIIPLESMKTIHFGLENIYLNSKFRGMCRKTAGIQGNLVFYKNSWKIIYQWVYNYDRKKPRRTHVDLVKKENYYSIWIFKYDGKHSFLWYVCCLCCRFTVNFKVYLRKTNKKLMCLIERYWRKCGNYFQINYLNS